MDAKEFKAKFRENYGYVHCEDVPDSVFQEGVDDMDNGMSEESAMDLVYDHIMSQGMCDYTE